MGSGYASMIGSIITARRTGYWGIRPLEDGEHLLGGDTAAPCRAVRIPDAEGIQGILDGMTGRAALLWSAVAEDSEEDVFLGSESSRPQVIAVLELRGPSSNLLGAGCVRLRPRFT